MRYTSINVLELCRVSLAASEDSRVESAERGRRDATLAQAILLSGRRGGRL